MAVEKSTWQLCVRRRNIWLLSILLIVIPATAFSQVTYHAKKRLLSVNSEGKLLSGLLSEVSGQTGIQFYVSPAEDRKVYVHIKDQPLEKAIQVMVRPLNHAFIYEGKSIKAVKVFERSEGEATARILPGVGRSAGPLPSHDLIKEKEKVPTRKELEATIREQKRQRAIAQGRLKEFKEWEARREERIKERERRRIERERMHEENQRKLELAKQRRTEQISPLVRRQQAEEEREMERKRQQQRRAQREAQREKQKGSRKR